MNIRHLSGKIAAAVILVTGICALADSSGVRELMPQRSAESTRVTLRQARSENVYNPRKTQSSGFTLSGVPMPIMAPAQSPVAQKIAASSKKLRGALIFNLSWYDLPSGTEFPYGVYELSTTEGNAEYTPVYLDKRLYVMDAIHTGDKYWISHAVEDSYFNILSMTYYTFNPQTWEVEKEQVGDKTLSLVTSTYDPVDEVAYCTWFENGKHIFGFLGLDDGQKYQLGTLTSRLVALAADSDGTLYAINDKGSLVEINKMTGKEARTIGSTGVVSYSRTSAVIDPDTKIMYYVDCGQSASALYAVDITTAAATKLYDMSGNEEFIGLYLEADDTPATVPAAPLNATVSLLEPGSLEGTVTFTVPGTFHDGSPATGEVSYTVSTGEGDDITAATAWGSEVTVPVSFEQPGKKSITITLSNATGTSKPATVSEWFGSDIPGAVTGASASYADGMFTIKWTAPETGANGGWFDASALRYDVVRVNDGVKVAQDIPDTQWTDPVEEPENQIVSYTYTITPICNGIAGEPVTTPKKSIGYILPPYSNSFDTSADVTGYTVLDSNKDGKKWSYNTSNACFRIQYNSSKAMDDYLFTPQMQLIAGRIYTFTFKARAHNNSDAENIEAVISTGTTKASIVATILENTQLTSKEFVTLTCTYTPETTGRYRFGFHAISPKNSYYLYVDDFEVSAGAGTSAPAAVEEFTVTPDADGALKALISFRTPSVDISGAPISSLSKVELMRDGELIQTWDNPPVGNQFDFTDGTVTARTHTYTATAYNDAGAGSVATQSVFIGYEAPEAPTGVNICMGDNTGTAVISWTAPQKDLLGNDLNPDAVTYTIVRRHGDITETVASGLTECSYTDAAVSADADQDFYDYGVSAQTTGGSSTSAASPLIPLGKPYDLPFKESFGNARISTIWGLDSNTPTAGWLLGQDTSIDEISSEDGDNGLAIMEAMTKGSTATLFSGSIAIPNEGNPTLAFAYFNHNSQNTLDVIVAEAGSDTGRKLTTITLDPTAPEGWVNVPLSLDEFKGKNVQLYFTASVVNTTVFIIDNIRVENRLDHNLSIRALSLPSRMTAGNDYEIVAVYENKGINPASGYTVELSLNGELLESRPGDDLAAGQTASMTFLHSVLPTHDEQINISAKILYAQDLDEADNTSAIYAARRVAGDFPVPETPEAVQENNDVALSWQEPDLSITPMEAMTEDAEEFTAFSTGLAGSELFDDYIGGWTMVDNDGVVPFDITSGGKPVIYPNCRRPVGFMVIDSGTLGEGWEAHSGTQMFASFASGSAPNDDWMISPLLSGQAQTVKFYGRSVTLAYGFEEFEVLYSTTDLRLSSFTRCLNRTQAPGEWTEYTFNLPEGARYFAIRCVSSGTFAFLVDDITFTAAHPNEGLTLTGYNIYRDGSALNEQPLTSADYRDLAPGDGNHSYCLSALYNRGESELSKPVSIQVSGVEDLAAAGIRVFADGGTLVISGAEGKQLSVVNLGGVKLFEAQSAPAVVRLQVAREVYLVKVDGKSYKIIVK